MGKKSREKRERRERGNPKRSPEQLLKELRASRSRKDRDAEVKANFQRDVMAVERVLGKYVRFDAAVALGVSDIWPPNVASPVKHLFAFAVLLGMDSDHEGVQPIKTYEDFARFVQELYSAWPSFPALEDFSPEADWGQFKVRLGDGYVPMFYGSSLERLPDFVQAFRITHAANPAALADMDFAVAIQASLIGTVPNQLGASLPEPDSGHVETPDREFWESCSTALFRAADQVDAWRAKASNALTASMGAYKAPLTWEAFGNAVMMGQVVPFLGVEHRESWAPVSVRSGPGVVIDHWAEAGPPGITAQTQKALGHFIAERFRRVHVGPMTLRVDRQEFSDLHVSCATTEGAKVYVFCVSDHQSLNAAGEAANSVYAALKSGGFAHLRLEDGRALSFGRGEQLGPDKDDLQIVIVLTQSGTGFNMLDIPEQPTRVLPLVDLISIFDALRDFQELERFWSFIDAQQEVLSPFSRGLGDLFATFRDTHGVLVDGADTPTMISLAPHWGSSWRFRNLSEFWAVAPRRFPDGSEGWQASRTRKGVVELRSRHHLAVAYSTEVGECTVQALVVIAPGLEIRSAKMLDLFAHLVIDALHESVEKFADDELFLRTHLVLSCNLADSGGIEPDQSPAPLEDFERVVLSAVANTGSATKVRLMIHAGAVEAGLNGARNGSFEARCLKETLERCSEALEIATPQDLDARLAILAAGPARYQLQVATRTVDVPDNADPVLPTPTEYKLARKALAVTMKQIGLEPGRYELQEAKVRINSARDRLRIHIEDRIKTFDPAMLVIASVEQHDELLLAERMREARVRQSRTHEVDYDRLEVLSQTRKEFGGAARNYRYLLEKTHSSASQGVTRIDDESLRELIALVDWYMVLASASDVLHNAVDVGGVEIDDSFVPEVFYSTTWQAREAKYAKEMAKIRLGEEIIEDDSVEGATDVLTDKEFQEAFRQAAGFDLRSLLQSLTVLSQPVRHGLAGELSSVYLSTPERIAEVMVDSIDDLSAEVASTIVSFLTLSGRDIRRLAGKTTEEADVPFWEHSKRLHRYAIRPLVPIGTTQVTWGAELASRVQRIWLATVRDGVLPAEFPWPHVQDAVRAIKESIETALEKRTEEIFRRHTPYVAANVDFFRRFSDEKFDDVGDFDCLAYWPKTNTLVFAECKYNQPAHSLKDSRRLRDRIFGEDESDRRGQFSRIRRRREFLSKNRDRMLDLLNWPKAEHHDAKDVEMYVSRDLHYWMVHTPYAVPTKFIRVDALNAWISLNFDSTVVRVG